MKSESSGSYCANELREEMRQFRTGLERIESSLFSWSCEPVKYFKDKQFSTDFHHFFYQKFCKFCIVYFHFGSWQSIFLSHFQQYKIGLPTNLLRIICLRTNKQSPKIPNLCKSSYKEVSLIYSRRYI